MSTSDARSDEANTAVLLTSATPIIRADALDDVRRGVRATFWRASAPGTLNSFSIGQPITRVTGRGDRRRQAGDTEEQQERADAGQRDQPGRAARAEEQPDDEHRDADDGDDDAGDETARPHGGESELRVASRRPAGSSRPDATAR